MDKRSLDRLFAGFSDLTALVIGDMMVDSYVWGTIDRISPEAPVPVVNVSHKEERFGGAANVLMNLCGLGAKAIPCSVVGDDELGKVFSSLLKKNSMSGEGIIFSRERRTTVKTRVIASRHQLLRIDEEQSDPLTKEENQMLHSKIAGLLKNERIDVIILQDYDKGIITPELIAEVAGIARQKNIPVVADPKNRNFTAFRDITLFKPNLKEMNEGLQVRISPGDKDAIRGTVRRLREEQQLDIVLLTLSDAGVFVCSDSVEEYIAPHPREIADVSGAGDTVVSVAALALASGLHPVRIASLANIAGGLVCERLGVAPINKEQLLKEAQTLMNER